MMLGEVAARRCRLRPLRHARPRDHRGLRRRPDGRPHPGVPRQEDRRRARSSSSRSTSSSTPALVLVGTGARDRARRGRRPRSEPRRRTACPRCSTRSLGRQQQRLGLRRPHREHRRASTPPSALCMLLGRFLPIVLVLALAGSLAAQQQVPAPPGRCPPHRPLFVGLLVGVVVIVAGLTFFPALALGPARGRPLMTTLNAPPHDPHRASPRRSARPARPDDAAPARCRTPCASSTRACGATRSCSSSRSARCFTTVARRRRPHRCSPGRSPSGCGSPCLRQPRRGRRRGPRQGPGRDPAQATTETTARRRLRRRRHARSRCRGTAAAARRPRRRRGRRVIPGDGDVVEGIATVDESAITGESAPVIRESGGDRSAVTGGTKVLSDRIVVRITRKPGETLHRPDDRPRRGRRPGRRPRTRSR